MKTPEEIKKGLECMANADIECDVCPYRDDSYLFCSTGIVKDAIACIEQLEANDSQVKKALQDNGFGSLEELLQAYSQVKRERDAAVNDLKSVQGGQRCERCKNYGGTEFIDAVCIECINGSIWEWRGVQEGGNDV